MKSSILIRLATQSIQKNKMRAMLTMLGIIIGVAAVIVMVAVGFSGAVGVFFGYYPAQKAAALHPIEALRYE